MISLLVLCPNPTDATSYYRGMRPLGQLKRNSTNIQLAFASSMDWSVMSMVDGFFMQRPFNAQHLQAAKMATRWKVPIWVDYDDDLFSVTPDNPAYKLYGRPEIQKNIAEICAMAKVVTVSTSALKQAMAPLNDNISVISNGYDLEFLGEIPLLREEQNPLILWRGSETHQRDLMVHAEEIIEAARRHPNYTWHFQGYAPWMITEQMPKDKVVVAPAIPIEDYFELIKEVKPKIVITPLANNRFNQSKSNIAWIEATHAGAVCLAPNWEEWKVPGVVNYNGRGDFLEQLDVMLLGKIDLRARHADSRNYISAHLSFRELNKGRADAIRALTGKGVTYATY